ncbi:MAG: LAGLIDADG family homing endonuclease [Candidatus Nealsonbacteria bacterium]
MDKRSNPWNKGLTKETNASVLKVSKTFKRKKLDNFKEWRDKMKKIGKIPSFYPPLNRDGDLAELIGVVLGDGHIESFPRTESLTILSNGSNKGFIKRYVALVKKLFNKTPYQGWHGGGSNCIRIRIYQKNISKRLGIPCGNRSDLKINIPRWIIDNREYVKRYLRGLYEAEGSFCVHIPTYTYKFLFSNKNKNLLRNVYRTLKILGFHPHESKYQIQISKKEEVYKAKELIKFRKY